MTDHDAEGPAPTGAADVDALAKYHTKRHFDRTA